MHTSKVSVDFDPSKDALNRRKHGVSLADAEGVLSDPWGLTVDDPDAVAERRLVSLGDDGSGRVLVVVYTIRGQLARVISARKASPSERATYEKQLRLR